MANKWDERKKAQEDEYFVKKERELVAKLKAKQEAEAKESAQESFLHEMPEMRRVSQGAQLSKNYHRPVHRLQRNLARCRRARAGCGKGYRAAGWESFGRKTARDRTTLLDSGKTVPLGFSPDIYLH